MLLAGIGLLGTADGIAANCKNVKGQIQEHPATTCSSPFGLCTDSSISGDVVGTAHFTATNIVPIAGTPYLIITGDVSASVQSGGKTGTLTLKSNAAYNTATGDIIDFQAITGGTLDFKNASGALGLTGKLVNGSGMSNYNGTICTQ
jgi:hypothetical protein